ncbi:DUF6898 family protein [Methylopila turkensis]|uniref:DUF6898 family protein n=1 Tax=Methylopila turkensis TaxID=1437816 RepID=UPI0022F2D4B6|nr:hypothetical protein [Methylopila turkensis]
MTDGRPRPPQAAVAASGETLFEITIIGAAARCAAIDAATGVEVVVTGPANAAETHLKTLALRKLRARLERS